ncbi:hypothetical protein ACWEFJ_19240 [Actinosynnema sp. NPDC004786]
MTTYPGRVRGRLDPALSRWLWLVKWLPAIPHLLIVGVFLGGGGYVAFRAGEWAFSPSGGLVGLLVLIAGVVLLVTGRYPRGVLDFVLGMDCATRRLDRRGDEPGRLAGRRDIRPGDGDVARARPGRVGVAGRRRGGAGARRRAGALRRHPTLADHDRRRDRCVNRMWPR